MICDIEFVDKVVKPGVPDMPSWNRDNLPDLPRAMPVKVSVKDGKISR